MVTRQLTGIDRLHAPIFCCFGITRIEQLLLTQAYRVEPLRIDPEWVYDRRPNGLSVLFT
jgi:hypothetical protein